MRYVFGAQYRVFTDLRGLAGALQNLDFLGGLAPAAGALGGALRRMQSLSEYDLEGEEEAARRVLVHSSLNEADMALGAIGEQIAAARARLHRVWGRVLAGEAPPWENEEDRAA